VKKAHSEAKYLLLVQKKDTPPPPSSPLYQSAFVFVFFEPRPPKRHLHSAVVTTQKIVKTADNTPTTANQISTSFCCQKFKETAWGVMTELCRPNPAIFATNSAARRGAPWFSMRTIWDTLATLAWMGESSFISESRAAWMTSAEVI